MISETTKRNIKFNCKECGIKCQDKSKCVREQECLDDPYEGIITTYGNGWYINNCGLCGKYDKKPLKEYSYGKEYFCKFEKHRNNTDYRCLNTGLFNRHNEWGKH